MDVEIVKSNGKKYRLSDYGVVQDFVVNSIERTINRESIDGRRGSVDYGSNVGDRTITVPMIFKANDLHDFAHLRDELYGILDDDEPFYIREMRRKEYLQYEFVDFGYAPRWDSGIDNEYVNGKQYKVRMDGSLSPEQWDDKPNGEITIEFVTSGLPYAESIYTTLELHDSGYDVIAEKYGLVDNIDDEKVQYRFTPNLAYTHFASSLFENGSMYLSNGKNADGNNTLGRLKSNYSVSKNRKYWLELSDTSGTVNYIRIFHYDSSGNMIDHERTSDIYGDGSTKYEFTALGESIRFLIYANGSAQVNVDGIGSATKISLSRYGTNANFTVYNAGNVKVEPESAQLYIQMNYATSDGSLKMTNKTTRETFEYYRSVSRRHIVLNGMVMTESGSNRFRNSNRRFISLAPGDNEFEITGASFDEIFFRFKYLYK